MNKTKQFALHFAAAALLVGTSAFAESRHSDATTRNGEGGHDRGDRTQVEQRSQVQQRDTSRSSDQRRNDTSRNWDNRSGQNRTWQNDSRNSQSGTWQQSRSNQTQNFDRNRSYDRNNNNYNNYNNNNRNNNNRNYSTNRSYDRNRGGFDRNRGGYTQSYNRGNAYYHDGRISRIERWNGGYRVYLGGALYPFFIPEARFRLFPYRVGLSIQLGGFYNPLGYYDYYDAGNYGNYGGYGAAATSGDVRGLVESVDYRRGSLVIRDDVSGNFVTVMMRGGDPQFDSLRNGDYVDLSGEWVRGYFQAYGVARLDNGNGYYQR